MPAEPGPPDARAAASPRAGRPEAAGHDRAPHAAERAAQPVRFTTREGLTLAGDAWGPADAPPVLLLHGGGQTRHAWAGTAAILAEHGWRAIALDQRGHGDSDWHAGGAYETPAYARDLIDVVARLPAPPVLVGASLGGLASLLAIDEGPQPIARALVLVDVATRLEPRGIERIFAFMRAAPDGFASLEEAADAVAAYNPHRPRPRDTSGLARNLRRGADGRWRWHWDPRFVEDRDTATTTHPLREASLEDAARRLTLPTLLVRGRMSDVLSEDGARRFLELVPHARLVDVREAGHMVAGDRNDVFARAVIDFLDSVRDGASTPASSPPDGARP